jgi:hypothetical protein
MDEIDEIYNWNGLKYGIYKRFDMYFRLVFATKF